MTAPLNPCFLMHVQSSFQAVNTSSSHGGVFTWDGSGVTPEHVIISHTNYRSSVCVLSVKTLIKPPFIAHELIMSVLNYNISVWANLLCATLQLQQHKVLQNTDFRQRAKNMWCVNYRGAEIQERTLLSLQTQFAPEFRPIESQWSVILSCHVSDTFEIYWNAVPSRVTLNFVITNAV